MIEKRVSWDVPGTTSRSSGAMIHHPAHTHTLSPCFLCRLSCLGLLSFLVLLSKTITAPEKPRDKT